MAKGMYHSEMESETQRNHGLWLTLTKTPTNSKSADIAGFASCAAPHNPEKTYVNLENAQVRAAFERAPVGQAVWVEAGGKGAEAWAVVKNAQGGVIADSRQMNGGSAPAPAGPPQGGPPSGPPAGPPPAQQSAQSGPPAAPPPSNGNGNGSQPSLARVYHECAGAAMGVLDQLIQDSPQRFEGLTADAQLEFIHVVGASLFIEWNRSGGQKVIRQK